MGKIYSFSWSKDFCSFTQIILGHILVCVCFFGVGQYISWEEKVLMSINSIISISFLIDWLIGYTFFLFHLPLENWRAPLIFAILHTFWRSKNILWGSRESSLQVWGSCQEASPTVVSTSLFASQPCELQICEVIFRYFD